MHERNITQQRDDKQTYIAESQSQSNPSASSKGGCGYVPPSQAAHANSYDTQQQWLVFLKNEKATCWPNLRPFPCLRDIGRRNRRRPIHCAQRIFANGRNATKQHAATWRARWRRIQPKRPRSFRQWRSGGFLWGSCPRRAQQHYRDRWHRQQKRQQLIKYQLYQQFRNRSWKQCCFFKRLEANVRRPSSSRKDPQ